MDTEKCRALLAVLDTGSLTAAAARLGYTASGISRMMAALEDALGFTLLERGRSGVLPTAACRELLPVIQETVNAGQRLRESAAAIRGVEVGSICVGSAYGAYYLRLAETVAAFSKAHPGIRVQILQGSSSNLCSAIEAQTMDFAIVSRREGAFTFLPLLRDPMCVWVPEAHPLAALDAIPIRAFETEPYIATYAAQSTDNDHVLRAHGLTPTTRFSTIDDRATAALVRAGLGISMNNGILAEGLDLPASPSVRSIRRPSLRSAPPCRPRRGGPLLRTRSCRLQSRPVCSADYSGGLLEARRIIDFFFVYIILLWLI